jgi:hypothetical protein
MMDAYPKNNENTIFPLSPLVRGNCRKYFLGNGDLPEDHTG